MPKKKDICSLADGKNILEIAYYGPGDHKKLEEERGHYWFEKEVLISLLGQYSNDYKDGGATRQHFGLGSSPEEAVKSALTTLIAKYEPIVASAEKALKGV